MECLAVLLSFRSEAIGIGPVYRIRRISRETRTTGKSSATAVGGRRTRRSSAVAGGSRATREKVMACIVYPYLVALIILRTN